MNGPSSSAGASPELSPAFALAGRLAAGETLFVGWVGLPGLAQVEIVARAGFDALVFDLQHGLFDIGDVVGMIGAAAAAGRPSIVRVGVEDFAAASRALDFGAAGVIAPMINSAADARRFVEFVKYPPLGRRSWGPGRAMNLSGVTRPADHLAQANGFTIALAMIETREGLANLDAILAVDGIDGVFVGPMDLSIALSEGRDVDATGPRLDEPLFRVAAAAARVGKIAGIFGGAGERARLARLPLRHGRPRHRLCLRRHRRHARRRPRRVSRRTRPPSHERESPAGSLRRGSVVSRDRPAISRRCGRRSCRRASCGSRGRNARGSAPR